MRKIGWSTIQKISQLANKKAELNNKYNCEWFLGLNDGARVVPLGISFKDVYSSLVDGDTIIIYNLLEDIPDKDDFLAFSKHCLNSNITVYILSELHHIPLNLNNAVDCLTLYYKKEPKMGRRVTGLPDNWFDVWSQFNSLKISYKEACHLLDVPSSTFYYWLNKYS